MLAGGLIAAPLMSNANYFSGSDAVIKIALVGCGGRGTGAASQALLSKQNVRIVAMADAFRDNLDACYLSLTSDEMAESIGGKAILKTRVDVPEERKFTGFDGYLQAIALADVVVLATPPGFRPIHFAEAIKQNKHVFMEKPVATDPAGIQSVLATAAIAKQKKAEQEQKLVQEQLKLKKQIEQKEQALEQQRQREKEKLAQAQRDKKELALKEQKEKDRKDKERKEQEAKRNAQDERKLQAMRDENLRRMAGMAGATGSPNATGDALRASGPSPSYGGRIIARVKPNIVFNPDDISGNPVAEVEVRTAPDGKIMSRKLIKSSGNKAWDEAVIKALDKTDTLPRDTDGTIPTMMVLGFKPRD